MIRFLVLVIAVGVSALAGAVVDSLCGVYMRSPFAPASRRIEWKHFLAAGSVHTVMAAVLLYVTLWAFQ